VKDFDGWAAVILPVDVTVQQSGVLRTNSNKTPEKTHKCLSRNDRATQRTRDGHGQRRQGGRFGPLPLRSRASGGGRQGGGGRRGGHGQRR